MFEDERAGEVEDLDGLASVEDAHPVAAEGAAEAELDPANSTDPLSCTTLIRMSSPGPGSGVCGVAGRGATAHRGRVPCPLRGDAAGQALVRTVGVVDDVELVDLRLQLLERVGERLLVEEPEQGLVDPFDAPMFVKW